MAEVPLRPLEQVEAELKERHPGFEFFCLHLGRAEYACAVCGCEFPEGSPNYIVRKAWNLYGAAGDLRICRDLDTCFSVRELKEAVKNG